jgi:hypothetical protein
MMATEPQRHITVGSPLSNETTPTRLGLPYASDRSVQKRKLTCRTLYNVGLLYCHANCTLRRFFVETMEINYTVLTTAQWH